MISHPHFASRCKNWTSRILDRRFATALAFLAAPLIYGGLHVLASSAHFSSITQQRLWRISAYLVINGIPLVIFILIAGTAISIVINKLVKRTLPTRDIRRIDRTKAAVFKRNFHALIHHLMIILMAMHIGCACIVCLAFVLARGYLVVESFITLADLPAGVYDVPNWSAYFPHLS